MLPLAGLCCPATCWLLVRTGYGRLSGEPWSSESACMWTSTMSADVAVVGVRSTGAEAEAGFITDGAEPRLDADAMPGGEPMVGIEFMLGIEPMAGVEPMLDAEPTAGVEPMAGVESTPGVEAVPGVGVMVEEDVPEEADARATGMETGIGRGVGMLPAAAAAGTCAPLGLPRRPDCVSDTVGCGIRCERRLLRSIMLMAQASRSTGVRFEAWMKGSVS